MPHFGKNGKNGSIVKKCCVGTRGQFFSSFANAPRRKSEKPAETARFALLLHAVRSRARRPSGNIGLESSA